MNIDIKDIITLSNKKRYVVVSKINYNEEIYYFVAEVNNNTDIKFLCENKNNNTLIEVKDKELINEIFPLLLDKTKIALAELAVDLQDSGKDN